MQLPHQHRATLGRAITEGREGRGLDRDELAELSGVPALVIAGLEAGQLADVPAEYVGPLARSLGVWPSALLIAAGLHIQAPLPEGVEDVRQLNDLRRARHLEAAPDTYLRLRLADARDRLGEAGYARLCRSLYAAWEAAADAALTAAWLASGADAGPRG